MEITNQYELPQVPGASAGVSSPPTLNSGQPIQTVSNETGSNIEAIVQSYVNNAFAGVAKLGTSVTFEDVHARDINASGDLNVSNRLVANFGSIGGWTMNSGVLSTPKISIDSNNQRIRSYNYLTGTSGFTIQSDLIEAENIIARGTLRGATFSYDVVNAVGGQLMVTNADTLKLDMTALDNATLTIKGDTTFAVNDLLVMRGVASSGVEEEWLRVTDVTDAPTYIVTRDLAGLHASNANPMWKAGTPVVKQGKSDGSSTYSGGWLRLIGEGTNSPYYSVFARTGVAYNAYTETVRMGNLNGIGNNTTDVYGFFAGDTTNYFQYDPTSGLSTNNLSLNTTFVAGENITNGDVVCVKPSYTDYIASEDTYVYQNASGTNYSTEETLKIGQDAGGFVYQTYIKWDLSTFPSAENILKVELIVYENTYTGGPATIGIERVTSTWTGSTLTYATAPTRSNDLNDSYGSENSYTASANGSYSIDITQLVRQWKDGAISNYGIYVHGTNGASTRFDIYSSETTSGTSNKPKLRVYTTDTSETGIYKADCSDYMLSRAIVGIAQETKSASANTRVQIGGKVSNVTIGSETGGKLYLRDVAGGITTSTNNLNRVIKLGNIIETNKFLLNIQDQGILIESLYGAITVTGTKRFYAPKDARYARVYFTQTAGTEQAFYTDVYRDNDGLDSYNFGTKVSGAWWNFSWGSNYIEVVNPTTGTITNIYFYN